MENELALRKTRGILPNPRGYSMFVLAPSLAIAFGLCTPTLVPADDFVAVDLLTNPDSVVSFDSVEPWIADPQTALATLAGNFTRGIDFDSSTSGYLIHTAALLGSPTGLYRFQNGAATLIAQLPSLTENDCGLTLNPDHTTLYFSLGQPRTDDVLFRCSTEGTFAQIGPIHRAEGIVTDVIGLAMSDTGILYGLDTADDSLIVIEPLTGAATRVGGFGVSVGGEGEMDFDENTGQLIMAGDQVTTRIYDVDVTTGHATYLGDLPFVTSAIAFAADVVTPCPMDLDNGSGTGIKDGAVTIDDLLYFLSRFEAGSSSVDLDNGTGTGTGNGAVDVDDLLYFLFNFEQGC